MKLVGVFEGKNELSINIALRNVTSLTSQDISIAKYVTDLTMKTQILLSLIPPTTTVKEFVEMLQIQTLLSGLPEEFDSLKTQMRATPALTIAEINTRVLNEDAAMRAVSSKVAPGQQALRVGNKDRRISKTCKNYGCPKPKGHLSEECWFKYPELKAKFDAKKRDGRKDYDGAESAKATANVPSQAWCVKSVACEVNLKSDKSVAHQNLVKKATSSCHKPKSTITGVEKLVTQTFNMDSACTSTIMNNASGLVSVNLHDNSKFSLADTSLVVSQGSGLMPGKNLKVNIIKSFSENLLSIPQLFEMNYATVFHPTHGIIIANANQMQVTCSVPLGIGKYVDGTFLMDINVGPLSDKACATGAIAACPEAARNGVSFGIPLAIAPVLELSTKCILWYKRLGFTSVQRIVDAIHHNVIKGIDLPVSVQVRDFPTQEVEAAQLAQSSAQPHRDLGAPKRSSKPYQMLHIDFKYIGIRSWGGSIGESTIVDDYSRRIHQLPLRSKKQFVQVFKEWYSQTILSQGYRTQTIRCDNGTEIKNYKFNEFMTEISARTEFTSSYSPDSDGVAERAHQTILKIGGTLRLAANLPTAAWAELLETACLIHSYLPCRSNPGNMSPYQMIYDRVPDVAFLRVIGSVAYVHKHKPTREHVLDTRASKGILLGYARYTKGYRILMSQSPVHIVETMHVTFAEDLNNSPNLLLSLPDRHGESYFASYPDTDVVLPPLVLIPDPGAPVTVDDPGTALPEEVAIPDPDVNLALPNLNGEDHVLVPEYEYQDFIAPVLRHPRSVIPKSHVPNERDPYPARARNPTSFYSAKKVHRIAKVRLAQAYSANIPSLTKFSSIITDPRLVTSMTKTIHELFQLKAIEIVPLEPKDHLVKAIWVHQHKLDDQGNLLRIKSRLCPQGFRYRPHIDYDPDAVASYAPHVQTINIGLMFEVQRTMYTTHLDVENCFQAHCDLPLGSRILLRTPDGFNVPEGSAIRLVNALQGSPQSGRIWQEHADHFLLTALHFRQSSIDPAYYFRWDGECYSQIIRATDDFRVSSDKDSVRADIVSQLMSKWKMSIQVGKTWNGMAIMHDRKTGILQISMKRDIENMLNDFGMKDCKPDSVPAVPGSKLRKAGDKFTSPDDEEASRFPYREAVGGLLWFARTGRPDILNAVSQVSRFSHQWDSTHVTAVKKIMRYLKGTMDLTLTFRKTPLSLQLLIYGDADFAGEPEENELAMRSTSAFVAFIRGIGAFTAFCGLEKTLSHSTAESEYTVISRIGKFSSGITQMFDEIGHKFPGPTVVYSDNQAAIAIANTPFCTSAMRHMKIKHHYIKKEVKDGKFVIKFCKTEDMIADMLTKALPRPLFEELRDMLLNGLDKDGNII
jgi:hypothetical protein